MKYEIAISLMELVMVGIICLQFLALFLLSINLKILKNGTLQKQKQTKKKLPINQEHLPIRQESITSTKNKRSTNEDLSTKPRRNTPLRQRDDKYNYFD